MTPNLTQKLTRIESLCRACLELDAKIMPAPWEDDGTGSLWHPFVHSDDAVYDGEHISLGRFSKDDLAFIAHARDLCPRFARSTLTAIAALRKIHEMDEEAVSAIRTQVMPEYTFDSPALAALTEIASHFENVT